MFLPSVPATADEVTASWLQACLGSDSVSDSITVTRIGVGYGLAGTILRVASGARSIVVKLWRAGSESECREVHVRQRLGDDLGPRVPKCRYAAVDPDTGHAVIVMEDLGGAVQGDCLTDLGGERAVRLAESFARLHAAWWNRTESAEVGWLPSSPYLALTDDWLHGRSHDYLNRFGDRLPREFSVFVTELPLRYHLARHDLATAAPTLTHGDVHLDNVVFDAATGEPVLLDWSHASIGPGVLDVADLILAGPAAADTLVDAYRSRLCGLGVPDAVLHDLDSALAAATVIALIRSTLGIARWRPGSARETAMIDTALRRSVSVWRER